MSVILNQANVTTQLVKDNKKGPVNCRPVKLICGTAGGRGLREYERARGGGGGGVRTSSNRCSGRRRKGRRRRR